MTDTATTGFNSHNVSYTPGQMDFSTLTRADFFDEAKKLGLKYWRQMGRKSEARWTGVTKGLDLIRESTYLPVTGEAYSHSFFTYKDALVYITGADGREYDITIAAVTSSAADKLARLLSDRLPPIGPKSRDDILVRFWSLSSTGPVYRTRSLVVHDWENVRSNYPQATLGSLNRLFEMEKPDSGGKLLLLHGPPGVGKTNCIRALGKQWNSWCGMDYIVDPERLFGDSTYLMDVLMTDRGDEDRWTLLVLEDTDEFLAADAKRRSGQALSRLLNLSDGLIGQGLNILILITTNEPITSLHPAVSREGRTIANIEFAPFPASEAQQWLEAKGLSNGKVSEKTLAELYEVANQSHIQREAPAPILSGSYL